MTTKNTSRQRRRKNPSRPVEVPAPRVQEVLLELTYRLHATRPIVCPRPATGSVA
jgi:hypothetical protein